MMICVRPKIAAVALVTAFLFSAKLHAQVVCVGDCNSDREVTIDELLVGVGMALNPPAVLPCPAMDSNHDAMVTIDEIVHAVSNALSGCAS